MTEKEIYALLRKTGSAIYSLPSFPGIKIVEFIIACDVANRRIPITPKMQTIIDRSITPFATMNAAYSTKSSDILSGSSDVVTFDEMRNGFYLSLSDIKREVINAMPHNKPILVALQLSKISDFYHFTQAELLQAMKDMEINATKESVLHTKVLPMIVDLKTVVENPLIAKVLQFTSIESNQKKLIPIIKKLRTCLIANFGTLQEIFCNDLESLFEYLPIHILFSNVNDPNKVLKNQALIQKPTQRIFLINNLIYTKGMYIKADNRGSGAIYIWRSVDLVFVRPANAKKILGSSRDIFKAMEVGSEFANNLMMEVEGELDMVNVLLTARRSK